MLNYILNATNGQITASTFLGNAQVALQTMDGVPLGTIGDSATGEIAVKVKLIGASSSGGGINTGAAQPPAVSRVTSTGTAAVLYIARPTRRSVLIRNTDTANSVWVGPAGVTSSTGFLLKAGESIPYTSVALQYVVDDGSNHAVIHVADEYD